MRENKAASVALSFLKETVVCRFRPTDLMQSNKRSSAAGVEAPDCLSCGHCSHPTTSTCRPANCCFAACATLYRWAAGNDVSFGRCCLDLEGKRLFDRRYIKKGNILGFRRSPFRRRGYCLLSFPTLTGQIKATHHQQFKDVYSDSYHCRTQRIH